MTKIEEECTQWKMRDERYLAKLEVKLKSRADLEAEQEGYAA